MTAAAHKVERERGAHARRADGAARRRRARARRAAGSDVAANGTRAVAVYACGPADLLEVVRLRRPVDEQGRARPHRVRRAARAARHRRALAGAAHQPPRRAAVRRPGRRARGDRPVRRRRALRSTTRAAGRSPTTSARSRRRSRTTSPTPPSSPSSSTSSAGSDRVLVGAPDELLGEFKGKLHPYLRERIAGRISVDVENASLDDVCARRASR